MSKLQTFADRSSTKWEHRPTSDDIIDETVNGIVSKKNKPLTAMDKSQKLSIVTKPLKLIVIEIKGSVERVAKPLTVLRISVHTYLFELVSVWRKRLHRSLSRKACRYLGIPTQICSPWSAKQALRIGQSWQKADSFTCSRFLVFISSARRPHVNSCRSTDCVATTNTGSGVLRTAMKLCIWSQ